MCENINGMVLDDIHVWLLICFLNLELKKKSLLEYFQNLNFVRKSGALLDVGCKHRMAHAM